MYPSSFRFRGPVPDELVAVVGREAVWRPRMEWLGLLGTLVLPVFFWLWKLRTNDLHNITERLDRIEKKLDDHFRDHLHGNL